jgi:hypothetical protein
MGNKIFQLPPDRANWDPYFDESVWHSYENQHFRGEKKFDGTEWTAVYAVIS